MDGFVGAATIENGGYDYHSGDRAVGEGKDVEAGRIVGQLFEVAARKGRDLMVYVFTDGGVSTDRVADNTTGGRGKFNWTGDDGEKAATFALVYRASATRAASPIIRGTLRQIGAYKENDKIGVDRQVNLISNDVTALAKAVVANYLALHGEEGNLAQVIGADPFPNALDQYLAFQRIR